MPSALRKVMSQLISLDLPARDAGYRATGISFSCAAPIGSSELRGLRDEIPVDGCCGSSDLLTCEDTTGLI